jgi:tetratricopeptide (TPR) repeat protein
MKCEMPAIEPTAKCRSECQVQKLIKKFIEMEPVLEAQIGHSVIENCKTFQPNYYIEFNGRKFDFSFDAVSLSRTEIRDLEVRYGRFTDNRIQSRVSADALEQFLQPFCGRLATVKSSTVFEFQLLADEFKTEKYAKEIQEFLTRLGPRAAPDHIVFRIERDLETRDLEAELGAHFWECSEDSLIKLPLPILSRAHAIATANGDVPQNISEETVNKRFDFFIRCLDRFGSPASSLFPAIPLAHLTREQLEDLQRRPFEWSQIPGTRGERVCALLDALVRATEELKRAGKAYEELKARVDQLSIFCGLQVAERFARDDYSSSSEMRSKLSELEDAIGATRNERAPLVVQEALAQLKNEPRLAGNPFAQWGIAVALDEAVRTEVAKEESREWLQRAADGGITTAQHNIAIELRNKGQVAAAVDMFGRAAKGMNPFSQFEYGKMLLRGWEGAPPRPDEGAQFLKRAADRGNGIAMTEYARWLNETGGNPHEVQRYEQTAYK